VATAEAILEAGQSLDILAAGFVPKRRDQGRRSCDQGATEHYYERLAETPELRQYVRHKLCLNLARFKLQG